MLKFPDFLVNMSSLIQLDKVSKAYKTEAGEFLALKNLNLQVDEGEFVAVIGKSGSGKSTLINMITGIDHPTGGNIFIAGTQINGLSENKMSQWRGKNLGIVFQFFQLLPTLTVLENVMLPMDLCGLYTNSERIARAEKLLSMVEIAKTQSGKLPSQLSGGQQQRVAIARALANDPKIIAADEPTGNLDSKTAELIFDLFARLVDEGKTIMMVTHDRDLAKRVQRTLVISDGEIIEEYLAKTFPGLTEKQLVWVTSLLSRKKIAAGEIILKKGDPVETLYIVTKGQVDVGIEPKNSREFTAVSLGRGKYFGEIELLKGGGSLATIRAAKPEGAEVVELKREAFKQLLKEVPLVGQQMDLAAKKHLQEHKSHTERRV
jgi:putative ABC transport system ATP-binding protein